MTEPAVKISLREQAEEAGRELTMRYRVYSKRVSSGQMTEAEKARGIGLMRAMRDTLRLFAEHENAIRATLLAEITARRDPGQGEAVGEPASNRRDPTATAGTLADVEQHPAVAAVLDAFPGSRVSVAGDTLAPTTHD
jgi:hypothetical protein